MKDSIMKTLKGKNLSKSISLVEEILEDLKIKRDEGITKAIKELIL